MAENTFNPDPFRGTSAPSFLGASRGRSAVAAEKVTADTSGSSVSRTVDIDKGESALRASQLGLSLFDIADKGLQAKQRREFQEDFDAINEQTSGVLESPDPVANVDSTVVPRQIGTANRELTKLQTAKDSGTIREAHYWARVQSVVRQMRAKYPGYRDQIDQMVGNITGQVPANILRRTLLQAEKEATSAGASQQKATQQLIKEMSKEGILPANWQEESFEELIKHRNDWNSSKARLEKDKQNLTSIKLSKERRQFQATQVLERELALTYRNILNPMAGTGSRLQQQIQSLQAKKDSGVAFSIEETNQLQATMAELQQTVAAEGARIALTYGGQVPNEQIQKTLDNMNGLMAQASQAVVDKNFGLAFHNISLMDNLKNADAYNFISKNPEVRRLAVLSTLPAGVQQQYVTNNLPAVESVIANTQMERVASGMPLSKVLSDDHAKGGTSPAVNKSTIEKSIRFIQDGKVPIELKKNAIKSLYGQANQNFLTSVEGQGLLTDAAQRRKTFMMMSTGKVAKTIWEMRDEDPTLWENYKNWAVNSFNALTKEEASTARTVVINRKFIGLKFNKATSQFEVFNKKTKQNVNLFEDVISNALEKGVLEPQAKTAINNLNQHLLALAPVFKQEGGDIREQLQQAVNSLGIDLKAKNVGPDIDTVFNVISEFLVDHLSEGSLVPDVPS